MEDPQQRQMNVYARFIEDDAQDDNTTDNTAPAKPVPGNGAQPAKSAARSAKPGLKKRAPLPK